MARRLVFIPRTYLLGAALAVGALAGCRQSEADEGPSWADTAKGDVVPSGARRLTVITDLHQPETVIDDPAQDCYFVSNMLGYGSVKDGEGYILRVDAADLTHQRMFAQGGVNGVQLDAPKGMTIQGDTLWTADIDKVRGFDRHTGAPVGTIDFAPFHAMLLNSIATGPDGAMRVTDTGIQMDSTGVIYRTGDRIFEIDSHRHVRVVAAGPTLDKPNGIVWDPGTKRWVTVGFSQFGANVYTMQPGSDVVTPIANGPGQFDGVDVEKNGRIVFSSWADSSVYELQGNRKRQIVRHVPSPAGIGVDRERGRLLIPMPSQDKVEVWSLPE